jgi:hypothetical protein
MHANFRVRRYWSISQRRADEYLGRKPGLWEATVSSITPSLPPQTAKVCLDADVAIDMVRGAKCDRNNVRRSANLR